MSETKEKLTVEFKKYMVNVMIPPECMDEDGAPCPHSHKEENKKDQNPV